MKVRMCLSALACLMMSMPDAPAAQSNKQTSISFDKRSGCWSGDAKEDVAYSITSMDTKTFIFIRTRELGSVTGLPSITLHGAEDPLSPYPGRTDLVHTYVARGTHRLTLSSDAPILVCARTENSFYDPETRMPSPDILPNIGKATNGTAGTSSADIDIVDRENIELMGLPAPVAASIESWQESCRQERNVTSQFTSDFITNVDVNGDGRKDFILNGDEKSCIAKDTGETTARGGGSGGTSLEIMLSSSKQWIRHEFWVQAATINRYDGFAILVATDKRGRSIYRLQGGKISRANKVPSGGSKVFELAR